LVAVALVAVVVFAIPMSCVPSMIRECVYEKPTPLSLSF
jgi:hypothetical protein